MTREEAIWWVNHLFEIRKEEYWNKGAVEDAKEVEEAQHIAIEALTSQNLTEPNNTCEVDLISRADAIGCVDYWIDDDATDDAQARAVAIKNALRYMPSADAVSREEYEEVKAYMDTLVDAFIEDGEELAESVNVVRCKDCKWYECGGLPCPLDLCESLGDDGFCSRGERIEE